MHRKRRQTLRRRYGRARRHPSAVYIPTLDGAWRGDRIEAQVGMPVRINLGIGNDGVPRAGADDYVITRVDTKHGVEGRIAVKPVGWAGSETWGDPRGYYALVSRTGRRL